MFPEVKTLVKWKKPVRRLEGFWSKRWPRTQWPLWQSSRSPPEMGKPVGQTSKKRSINQAFMVERLDRSDSWVRRTWQALKGLWEHDEKGRLIDETKKQVPLSNTSSIVKHDGGRIKLWRRFTWGKDKRSQMCRAPECTWTGVKAFHLSARQHPAAYNRESGRAGIYF